MAVIYLVRHGQASFGAENYDQLSELGIRQCFLLGEWMRATRQPVEHIMLGAMNRHHQSALAFWEGFGAPEKLHSQHWRIAPDLNEFDHEHVLFVSYPEFAEAGKLKQFLALQKNPRAVFESMFGVGLARWMAGEHDDDYAESWSAFKLRITNAVKLFQVTELGNVIAFTSGGPISAICQHMMAIPDSHVVNLLKVMMNSSVSKMIKADEFVRLVSINAVAHLESKGDKSLITYR